MLLYNKRKMQRKTYKFRIYPTNAQEHTLLSNLNLCRNLYNCALQERKDYYKTFHKSRTYNEQQNLLLDVKDLCQEYKSIHSQVLQDVLRRLDKAYKNFFRRIKSGETPGFPRFKGYNRYNSFTFPQSGFSIVKKRLLLSKIGAIKIINHRDIIGDIKTCSIIRSPSGKWHVCFSVLQEKQTSNIPKTRSIIGIDLGLQNFITTSKAVVIKPEKFLNKHLERLAKASRKFSKNYKNIKKKLHISRVHEKVVNCRNDWQHKIANHLIKENDIIFVEDLNIKNMLSESSKRAFSSSRLEVEKNHTKIQPKKRNIVDVSWGLFVQKLSYKAEYADKKVIQIDPRNTSKMCSNCSNIKEDLNLSQRIYRCSKCNFEKDRDLNAAINILNRGMESIKDSISRENRDIFSENSRSLVLKDEEYSRTSTT